MTRLVRFETTFSDKPSFQFSRNVIQLSVSFDKMSRTSTFANSSSLGRSDCGQFSSSTDYIHFDGQFNHLSADWEGSAFSEDCLGVLPLQQTVMQQKASSKAAKQHTVKQQTAMQQSSNLEGGKSQLLLLKKLSV